MTRLTSDVDALNELFTEGVTDLLGDLVMIVAIISVMLWMDVRLTLVSLLTVPMLFAATTWFRKGARKGYDLVRTRIARINAFLQEHFAGAQTVQIFNAEAKSLSKFDRINDEYRRANIDTIFYYAVFFPLVDLIGAIGVALIIWYGGYRVMQNTPGAHGAHARRARGFHSVFAGAVSADSRHFRQVQRAAGGGRGVASHLQDARSADCDRDA
jgi:ATP-binding cassette subfamily B multidrug efflux pump